jgi:hypothetical protein
MIAGMGKGTPAASALVRGFMFMGNEKNLVPLPPRVYGIADSEIATIPGIVIIAALLPGVPRRD